jgi:type IV secretion system protein VirB1
VLTRNYVRASKQYGNQQAALQAALSAYNTGDFQKGITNGYVGFVLKRALPAP